MLLYILRTTSQFVVNILRRFDALCYNYPMSMFVLHHGDNSFPRLLSTSLSKRRERLCWSLAERCPKVLRYFEIHPLPIDRPCASPKAHSEYYHTHTNQKYQAVPECARLSQKSGTHCARVSHVLNQTARWRRSKWSTGLRCNGWDAASLQERSRVLQVCVSRREPFCCTFDCIHGYITRIA